MNAQMRQDNETIATQLHTLPVSRGYRISLRTILQCRTSLGWTFRGSSYCQLIRTQNKEKRLVWAQRYRTYKDEDFEEVIFTDECTVQLETHRRFCCRKRGEPPRPKPKYDIHIIIVSYFYFCLHVTSLASTLLRRNINNITCSTIPINAPSLAPHIHTEPNTQSRYMSGQALVFVDGQAYALLMVLWKPLFTPRFLIRRLYHLSRMFIQLHTSSWPTMIRSTHHAMHSDISKRNRSTGGVPQLSRRTLTLSKICGTS